MLVLFDFWKERIPPSIFIVMYSCDRFFRKEENLAGCKIKAVCP